MWKIWVNFHNAPDISATLGRVGRAFFHVCCEPSNSRFKSINFIKDYQNFKIQNFSVFKIRDKMHQFQSQIAQFTDHPPKWACTFWNPHAKTRVLTHFCELSVSWEISRGKIGWNLPPPPVGTTGVFKKSEILLECLSVWM